MKMYSYEVTVVYGDSHSMEYQIDGVTSYEHMQDRVYFYAGPDDVVADFRSMAVISIIRGDECDPNPTQDSAA